MIVEQVYVFLYSILTGAIIGLLFDIFRAFRFNSIKDIWVYIQDVIFWLITAVIIITSAFLINEGELRVYMLIGYLLGAIFYMLLFSKFILGIFKFIVSHIRKACKMVASKVKSIFSLIKKSIKAKPKNKQKAVWNFKIYKIFENKGRNFHFFVEYYNM